MTIKDVKYSYQDIKFMLGPFVDFHSELEVNSTEYEDVVRTIQELHPDITEVKVLSFKK